MSKRDVVATPLCCMTNSVPILQVALTRLSPIMLVVAGQAEPPKPVYCSRLFKATLNISSQSSPRFPALHSTLWSILEHFLLQRVRRNVVTG
jgi:hypothetical protein